MSCSYAFFSAKRRSGVNTLYYIHTWKKLLNADWLRQMAFFSWPWGYFWYQEGIITDPDWLKVAPQRSVLSEIHWWMNILLNIFPFTCVFFLNCTRGYATQVRTLKVGVNLILNCPQSHGGLYNKMLGMPRGALIDKTSRRVFFGCSWFACLSLRKVDAIGINGLQMMQRETSSVKWELKAKSYLFFWGRLFRNINY